MTENIKYRLMLAWSESPNFKYRELLRDAVQHIIKLEEAMTVRECPDCGHDVTAEDAVCPECGEVLVDDNDEEDTPGDADAA